MVRFIPYYGTGGIKCYTKQLSLSRLSPPSTHAVDDSRTYITKGSKVHTFVLALQVSYMLTVFCAAYSLP